MMHRTLIGAGLVITLMGTAAAQSTTYTLEKKIDTLQRQMLEMQHELDTLCEQQKTDTEEARKRQAEHTEQVQTVKEQVTEQTLNLLERVKLGGYGSLRFESNSFRLPGSGSPWLTNTPGPIRARVWLPSPTSCLQTQKSMMRTPSLPIGR